MDKDNIIMITGLHGCGKSTQIRLIKMYLENIGKKVYVSKADNGINLKKLIGKYDGSDDFFITLLFIALNYRRRIQILEALESDKIVLLDRWDDIFDFYHSNFGPLSKNTKLKKMFRKLAFDKIKPDLIFYLKIEPTIAVKRCLKQKTFFNSNRINLLYQNKLFKYYENRTKANNWIVINGKNNKKDIFSDIIKKINKQIDYDNRKQLSCK